MEYVTVTEAAKLTGYTREGIYNFVRAGKIEGLQRFGRAYKIPMDWVKAHIRQPTTAEIARQEGVSRQAIYQRRLRIKKKDGRELITPCR